MALPPLHAVHPLLNHRHGMLTVYFLLVKEAMTAGTGIVGLILNKLLVIGISQHLVKDKEHNVLQVFVALVFGTFLSKIAQHAKLFIVSCHEQGKEKGARLGVFAGILYLASEHGFILMV